MKIYFRALSLIMAVVMLATAFTACGKQDDTTASSGVSKAVEIYGTDYNYTKDELDQMKKAMFS